MLVTEETEETPKTTCTGNQPWAARFVENILKTPKMLSLWKIFLILKKLKIHQRKWHAQEFKDWLNVVEHVLNVEKTKDTPEKILCGLNPGHVNFVENVFATEAD